MAFLERDPDALATLLRGQTQIPMQTEEEYQLEEMVPDELLLQAQEAIGQRGAATGKAYSVPSRQALKQSGIAELRKLFGLQQGEARAKAYPAQVAGEYGLQEARLKGGFDVESAKQKAIADAAQYQRQQEGLDTRQLRQQEFQGGQGELNRGAVAANTAALIGGRQSVAETGVAGREALARRKNPADNYWGPDALVGQSPDWLRRILWAGEGPMDAPQAGTPSTHAAELAPYANHPQYSALPFESLLQQGIVSGSPDDLEAYRQAWESR